MTVNVTSDIVFKKDKRMEKKRLVSFRTNQTMCFCRTQTSNLFYEARKRAPSAKQAAEISLPKTKKKKKKKRHLSSLLVGIKAKGKESKTRGRDIWVRSNSQHNIGSAVFIINLLSVIVVLCSNVTSPWRWLREVDAVEGLGCGTGVGGGLDQPISSPSEFPSPQFQVPSSPHLQAQSHSHLHGQYQT